tara:strand:+ start:707 stop:1549 length:843 start_codon:yes stop_codon:yes gene_type:complete
MIIWLASYPKSGNTFLRSILGTYFFTQDGNFSFDQVYKIAQFPSLVHFNQMNIDINNIEQTMGSYVDAQNKLNLKHKSKKFFKTHSAFFDNQSNNSIFSNLENSLGAIYIVRDPRNVVTSYAHHYSITVDEAFNQISDKELFLKKTNLHPDVFISSWSLNYLSWKKANIPLLLIKYEDLIKNTKEKLIEVFNFFQSLGMNKSLYDDKKLDKVIKSTQFNNMKKLEKEIGFEESVIDKKSSKKIPFFNLGPSNNWKNILDPNLANKIEKAFSTEMEELGYL